MKERNHNEHARLRRVLFKQTNRCARCGARTWRSGTFHMHHKVPIMNGGAETFDNVELLCKTCHKKAHQCQCRECQLAREREVFCDA